MSDLSSLPGEERKMDFGAVRSVETLSGSGASLICSANFFLGWSK
jgi:hypothetical protein